MLLHLPPAVQAALFIVAGSLITLLIQTVIQIIMKVVDNQSTERGRMFDLYKIVYPKKVEAASAIMDRAAALYTDLCDYNMRPTNKTRADELSLELGRLRSQAKAYESLLGTNITKLATEYHTVSLAFIDRKVGNPTALMDGTWIHDKPYEALTAEYIDAQKMKHYTSRTICQEIINLGKLAECDRSFSFQCFAEGTSTQIGKLLAEGAKLKRRIFFEYDPLPEADRYCTNAHRNK